jgi:hypothetical protein
MVIRLCHVVTALSMLATPSQASDCSLALVLALDVSGSVDSAEDRLQREGVASALLAGPVKAAFLGRAPVALFVFEWSMASHQYPLVPGWQIVNSEEDLARVADAVLASRRGAVARLNPPTAVGSALGYAADTIRSGPRCDTSTIDISGDGENNDGPEPSVAYDTYPLDDVTVNALVIGGAGDTHPFWDDEKLVAWFETEVLRGPGAFVIVANGYSDYARAMELKLLRELELPILSGLAARDGAS